MLTTYCARVRTYARTHARTQDILDFAFTITTAISRILR